jgi:KDO2-lipid IV(A) lauroyltransferase
MVDQNAALGGRFVPFFGTPASTMRGAAYFRELTGAAVICVHDLREKGRHRVVISDPIDLPDDEELALLTINRHFEDVIRQHKGKYFWLHPRWKRRPQNEDSLYPGLRI